MEKLQTKFKKGVEFLFYNKKYICVETKIISKKYGLPKLVITTTTKTIVICTKENILNLEFLGFSEKTTKKSTKKKPNAELIKEVKCMALFSDLVPIGNFGELEIDRVWSDDEDVLLVSGVSVRKLAVLLNRGINHINNRKRQLGLCK